jgi:thiamine-phosphate diphosphorylase
VSDRCEPPALIVLSDRHQAAGAGHDLPHLLESLCDVGDLWFLLRERDHERELPDLDTDVATVAATYGIPLLVASDRCRAERLGAVGVHLRAKDRVPADRPAVLGRSCHGTFDLAAAAADGVDYLTMSPVYLTASKPGYGPPVGTDGLAEVVAATDIPVFALGGVEPGRAGECVAAGAHGVAVMGAIMRAAEPAEVARRLVDEVHEARGDGR